MIHMLIKFSIILLWINSPFALSYVQSCRNFKFKSFTSLNFHSRSNFGSDIPPIIPSTLLWAKDDNESDAISSNSDVNSSLETESRGNNPFGFLLNLSDEAKSDIKSTIISFAVALVVRLFILEPRFVYI